MIGIKLNNRFLDLKKGSSLEIDRKNPFFAINDYASEGSTEPLSFTYTDNNALALDLPYQYYTERKKRKYEVELYDGNSFRGKCTLIIETGSLNLNNIEDTEISGYLVYGISNFFQEIKGKKLKDLTLGGVRNFYYTTNAPDDGSNGYWQHFHQTWTDDTIPYVFAPVRNEGFFGEDGPDWMNKLDNDSKLLFDFTLPLVPFVRLKYLVQQIFEEAGYFLDTSELDGTGWERLTLLNLTKITWTTIGPVGNGNPPQLGPTHAAMVSINLGKHVPQEKTISDFIVQMFNRYGWMPLFSPASKRCRLVSVRNYGTGTKRDWTPYANPKRTSSFNEDAKIFAFKNNIDDNDEYPSPPDFSNISFMLPAFTSRYYPAPTSDDEGRVYFAYNENQWMQARLNEDNNLYEWMYFADNIYDYDPEGATDTIETDISTLPVQASLFKEADNSKFTGLVPIMKQNSTKTVGYRTLLYLGMTQMRNDDGISGVVYPTLSSLGSDSHGNRITAWSNVYTHKLYENSPFEHDFGIIDFWWKNFLPVLQSGEENEVELYLPLHELSAFQWDDVILIQNIPYIVKNMVEPYPYKNYVQATLKRLVKEVKTIVITDPVTNEEVKIYARLTLANETTTLIAANSYRLYYHDIVISLYSNQAGTVPYTPSGNFAVYIRKEHKNNGTSQSIQQDYFYVNQSTQTIITQTFTKSETAGSGLTIVEYIYTLDLSNSTEYTII